MLMLCCAGPLDRWHRACGLSLWLRERSLTPACCAESLPGENCTHICTVAGHGAAALLQAHMPLTAPCA